MKKILTSIELFPPDFSGAGLRACRTIKRLQLEKDYEFRILSIKNSKSYKDDESLKIKRLNVVTPKIIFPLFILELLVRVNLWMLRNKEKVDIIHMYSLFWLNRVLMLSNILFYKKRTILEITLDGSDDPVSMIKKNTINRIFKPLTLFLLRRINKFVVQTRNSLNSCLLIGIERKNVWLRPNPIDEFTFGTISFKSKFELRKKLNLNNDFIMLNVGAITHRKNQLFLVKSMSALKKKKATLLLIGPAGNHNYYDEIKKYIDRNGLSDNVLLLDEQKNINEYMIASDLFVFASEQEGFGTVFGEAMISGLPILTKYLDGISNYISESSGKIIDKNISEKESMNAFVKFVNDVMRGRISFNREKIRKRGIFYFSANKIDKKYLQEYDSLTGKKVKL